MRSSRWITAAAVLLTTVGGGRLRAADETLPAVVHTRQTLFSIPFRLDAPRDASAAPTEVQLYVSSNGGAQWQVAGRAQPTENSFNFRAPHDGEYWFQIRTVDKQGRSHDPGKQPALRVSVDTTPPRLELTAARGSAGEVRVKWQAVDPNLKSDSLKLEYRSGSSTTWRPLSVEPGSGDGRSTRVGEATWAPADGGLIAIRAEISDRAGNPALSQAQVDLGGEKSDAVTGPSLTGSGANIPSGTRWNPDHSTKSTLGQPGIGAAIDKPAADPEDRTARRIEVPGRSGGGANSTSGSFSNYHPPVEQQFIAPENSRTDGLLPPGEKPVMVNTRTPKWNYEINSAGPSGVAKVEMWGTRDGGRTWSSFGVDPDRRSPISVSLPAEGLYGFRLTVTNGNGLGSPPPASGDLPEVWIYVDLTKPDAKFTSAEAGTGEQAGNLIFRWEASDKALAARPITLAFSPQAGGPWTTIAAGLENTGWFAWRLDSRIPDRVWMRMEVRDEAGNLTIVEPVEPIALDRARPKARILNLSPAEDNARLPRRSMVR